MIIKRIESTQKRRAAETASYIMDAQHDGEKLLAAGAVNTFAQDLDDAQAEMSADETAYSGPGNAIAHWVVSWRAGENPTAEQMEEFTREFLADQGMGNHKAIWALHGNTQNAHGHIAVLRVQPAPEADGKYKLQNFGARILRENGTSHEVLSARATVIDFCQKHGFTPDFDEIKKERHPDAIRLSQKIEAGEAQTGQKHPKRLIAEQARDIIRSAKNWNEMHNRLVAVGISFRIEDNAADPEKLEKYKQWGVLRGPENERIPLFALPKDCSLAAMEKRFASEGQSFEAQKTPASKQFYEKTLTANSAKFHARQIFNSVGSMAEAETLLSAKGMTLERQGKTGCYLRYGEADDQRMKLSALGGKYSLHALSKRYADSDHILSLKYASSIPTDQLKVNGKVNALSTKTLVERADRANDRATSADARAVSIAAEGVQAQTLAEALSDADAQAVALDQARRAHAAAAKAEARAVRAETALRQLETETHQKKENAMDLKPTTTPEKSTEKDSTAIEAEASKTKNPTLNTPQTEAAPKASDQEKVNKEKEFDISLDLCGDPPVPGIAADAAQDNAQTGPRLR